MESNEQTTTNHIHATIRAVVNVNEGAYNAQKQVNMAIMQKIGQLVIALRPEELVVDSENIYWKVPLCVVNLTSSDEKFPLQTYALVDAINAHYTMPDEFADEVREESTDIIHQLYPEPSWVDRLFDLATIIRYTICLLSSSRIGHNLMTALTAQHTEPTEECDP